MRRTLACREHLNQLKKYKYKIKIQKHVQKYSICVLREVKHLYYLFNPTRNSKCTYDSLGQSLSLNPFSEGRGRFKNFK